MHYLTHVWFHKGKRPIKRYAFDHRTRIFAFGALSFDKVVTEITPSPNSRNFITFLQKLQRKHKKLLLVMDNINAHFTKMAREFYKNKEIVIVPLPKYSPQCNPIEQFWRNTKSGLRIKNFSTNSSYSKLLKKLSNNTF
jgi:transposase